MSAGRALAVPGKGVYNAGMPDIRIGTSGYDYPEWRDALYPPGIQRKDYLSVYSRQFATLELNFSYYRMPEARGIGSLIDRADPALDFSIKAHRSLTHTIDASALGENAGGYLEGIEPLLAKERLFAVLFEFPYSFHYTPDNRVYLDRLLGEFTGIPSVVEFRNSGWFTDRVYDGLRERGASLCRTDMPASVLDPPAENVPAFDLAYLRFHGRNAADWWKGDNVSRYDYLYNREELLEWAGRLKSGEEKARRLRIYFNNHAKGNAVRNALMMKALMEAE